MLMVYHINSTIIIKQMTLLTKYIKLQRKCNTFSV